MKYNSGCSWLWCARNPILAGHVAMPAVSCSDGDTPEDSKVDQVHCPLPVSSKDSNCLLDISDALRKTGLVAGREICPARLVPNASFSTTAAESCLAVAGFLSFEVRFPMSQVILNFSLSTGKAFVRVMLAILYTRPVDGTVCLDSESWSQMDDVKPHLSKGLGAGAFERSSVRRPRGSPSSGVRKVSLLAANVCTRGSTTSSMPGDCVLVSRTSMYELTDQSLLVSAQGACKHFAVSSF